MPTNPSNKKPPRRPKPEPPPAPVEPLPQLLARVGIDPDDWDWVLFGDGSGSVGTRACGWATVSVERVTLDRQVWAGAMNRGTVNVAELMAYLQPLAWIAAREAARVSGGALRRAVRVHIVTDSQYCAGQGEAAAVLVEKNALLWALVSAIRRDGIVITWHHLKRDEAALNSFCDGQSKVARRLIESYNWAEGGGGAGTTHYDHNPD